MFGFGSGELLLLAAIALIALGPKQLPEVARVIGRMIGQFRRATVDFQRALNEASENTTKSVTDLHAGLQKTLSDTVQPAGASLKEAHTQVQEQIESIAKLQQVPNTVPLQPRSPLAEVPPVSAPPPAAPAALDEANQMSFDFGKKES